MKKKDKKVYSRLLSWLLVFTMVLSMIPLNTVTVQAIESTEQSVPDSGTTKPKKYEDDCQVTISGKVYNKDNGKDLANYTAGSELVSGYYYLTKDKEFINTASQGSGLVIASNATVYIYIPEDVTLTAKGADAKDTVGAGAGIHVPSGATLILIGEGTVKATGGNAEDGSSGSKGWDSSKTPSTEKFHAGKGGTGGNGGGGAGAGIGTPGGNGGSGLGSGGSSYSISKDDGANGYNGSNGQNGASAPAMGNVYAVSTMTITATGGQAETASISGGSSGSASSSMNNVDGWDLDRKIAGGAGGGAGGGGFSAYGIGTGGGGGGQGGGGGSAGYLWTYATVGGGGGGAGAGAGTADGGSYSYTGWFSNDRKGEVFRSSTSGNSVTNSTTGGSAGQSGYGKVVPNKGDATYATGGSGGKGGNSGAVSVAYNNNKPKAIYSILFLDRGQNLHGERIVYFADEKIEVTIPKYDNTKYDSDENVVFLGWEITVTAAPTDDTTFTEADTTLYQPGDVITLDENFMGDVTVTAKIVDISAYNKVDSDVVSINTAQEFKEDVHNQEYTFTTRLNGVLADMGTMELRNEYTGTSNGKKVSADKNGKYTYTADSRGNTTYNIYYKNALAAETSWIHTLENVNRKPVIDFYSTSVKIKVKGATSVKNVSLKAQKKANVYTLNLRNTDANGFLEYYIETVENTHDKYDLYVNDICLVKGIKLNTERNYVVYLLGTTVTLLKDNQPYLSTDGASVPKVDRDATTGNFDGLALIPFSERSDAKKPNGMQSGWEKSTYIFEEAYLETKVPNDLKGVLKIGNDFWTADAPTEGTDGIRGGYYKPGTNSSLVDARVSLDGKYYIVDYYTVSYEGDKDTADLDLQYKTELPKSQVYMKNSEIPLPAKVEPTNTNYFFYRWLQYWVDTDGDGVKDKGWNPNDINTPKVEFAYLAEEQVNDVTALGLKKYKVIGTTEFVADCLAKDVTIEIAEEYSGISPDSEGPYTINLGYVYEFYPNESDKPWVLPNSLGNDNNTGVLFGSDWIQNKGTVDAEIEYITHTNTTSFEEPIYQRIDSNNVKNIISPLNYADIERGERYFTLNIVPKAGLDIGKYEDSITVASKIPGASSYLEANKLTFKVAFEVKRDTIDPKITITLPSGSIKGKINNTDVYYYDKTDVPTIEISADDDDVANQQNAESGCVHDGTDVAYIKYYVHKLDSDEAVPMSIEDLEDWTEYNVNNKPQLEEGTYYVYVKAADNARTPNISYAISDKIIVDKTIPEIKIDKKEYCIGQEFTFTVKEKYLDQVVYPSNVTVKTKLVEGTTDTYNVTVTANSGSAEKIELSVKDKAGNENSIEVTIHGKHVAKLEKVREVSRFFHGRMYYLCTVCGEKWEDFDVRVEPTGIDSIKPYNFFEYYTAYEDGIRYLENNDLIENYDFDKDLVEDADDFSKIKGYIEKVVNDASMNAKNIVDIQGFLQGVESESVKLKTKKYVPDQDQDALLEKLLTTYRGIGLKELLKKYSDYVYPTIEDFKADLPADFATNKDFYNVREIFNNLIPLDEANELLEGLEERAEKVAKIKAELAKFDKAIAESKIPTLETVKATDKELLEGLKTTGEELLNTYSNELTDAKKAELKGILTEGYSKVDENGNTVAMPSIKALLARIDAVEKLIVDIEKESGTFPAVEAVTSDNLNSIFAVGQKIVKNFFEEFNGVAPVYKQNITDNQHKRLVVVLGYDPDEDNSEMNPEKLDGIIGKLIRIQMVEKEMKDISEIATGEKSVPDTNPAIRRNFTNSAIVTIDDVPYMDKLIARIDDLLETYSNNLTKGEKGEKQKLKELKNALKFGLTVVDNLKKDLQAIEEGVANLPEDDVVKSDSRPVIAGLMQNINSINNNYFDNLTDEQEERINELYSKILPAKQAKIAEVQKALEDVHAYAKPILDKENLIREDAYKFEVLLGTEEKMGMIDAILATDDTANDFGDNLTAAEREALETLRAKLQAKQYLLKPVEERIQELIDKLEDLPEVDLVKSSDEAFVNEVKGLVDELLKNYSKNLTGDEIAELNRLNDKIDLRSERINDVRNAYNALETEVNKIPDVEKVTKENLEKIEQLVEAITNFVGQYYVDEDIKDNFADVEKENIREWMEALSDKAEIIAEVQGEFEAIKEAVKALPNNEAVKATDEDAITELKDRANALLTNNAGNLTADETVELNKIVEALDEKLAIIDTVENAIQDITDKANALPENVTSDNKATIDEYVKAVETIESTYANNMTDEQEDALDAVKADLTAQQELLEALSNRLAQLEKDVDAVPAIEKVTMNDKANIEALLDEIADINNVSANNLTDAEKTELAEMEAELRNKLRQITSLDAKVKELAEKVALIERKDVTSDDTDDIALLAKEIQDVMSKNSGNLTPVQQSDLMGMKVTLSMKQAEIDEVAKAIETIEKANEKIPTVDEVTSDDAKAIDKLIDRIEDTLLDYENNLTEAEKAALAGLKDSLEQNQKAKIAEVADRIEEIEDLADAIPDADEITNAYADEIDALEAIIDETLNTYANNLTDAEKDALNALRQELIQKEVVIEDTNDLLGEIRRRANAISPVESVTGDEELAISDLTALVEATLDEHSDKLTKDEKSELKAIVKDLEQKQRRIDDVEELVTEIEEDFANIPETSEVTSDDASAIEKLIAKIDETVANYGNNLTDIQEDTLEAIKNELINKQAKIEEVADVISDIEEAADAIPSIDELTSEDSLAIKEVEEAIDDALNTYADNLTEKEKQALENLKKELAEKETAIKATEDLLAEIKLAAKQIPQLSKVTSANETAIADLMEKVEDTFDTHDKKLTDAQKEELAQIQNGLADKMEVVKTVEDILEGIREDANEIPNIAEVTGDDANAILILENAIDETLNTYANGTTENLTEAEVNELENIKADLQVKKAMIETVAEEVDKLVAEAGQIPSVDKVTSEDANAIDHVEARIDEIFENYGNNLTEEQKSILEELKAELTEKEVAIKNTADLLAEIREEAEAIPEINVVTSENEAEIDALLEKIARTSETHKDALTEAEKAELANIKKAVEEKKALIVNVENAIATIEVTADELIPAIENVTSEDEMAIDALVAEIDTMLNEYANNLTISQTAKLEAIKEELLAKKALIAEVADEIEEIEEAVAEIPSIEEVTSDDKEAIDSVIEAIDNVQNEYANNLTEAEANALTAMKNELLEKVVAIQETADLLAEIRREANAIPEESKVTSANATAIDNLLVKIDNTRDIHDEKLTRAEKSELKGIEKVLESKKEKIQEVMDALEDINEDAEAIPSVDEITSANTKAIDALKANVNEILTTYANNMTDVEKANLEEIKNVLAEKEAKIAEVAETIDALEAEADAIPSVDKVTSADTKAIEVFNAKVDTALTNYENNLTNAERKVLESLKKAVAEKEAKIEEVANVISDLKAEEIPTVETVTSADVETIEALNAKVDEVIATYGNNMTESEKAELDAIKKALAEKEVAIQGTADLLAEIRKAAKEIPAVENVTSNNETAVDVLLEKVDATSEVHKDKLTDAEKAELASIKSALEAKKAVIVKVKDAIERIEKAEQTLPTVETVTSANAETIKALAETIETTFASCANNMTDVEKADLTAIQNALAEREAKIAEVAEVISTLKADADAIPSVDKVTSADVEAIKALNAKVDDAIDTYGNNMTDAEVAELEAIKKALAEKEVAIQDTKDLLAEIRKAAEAIPAVDKVTSANAQAIDALNAKVDATSEVHKDKLTDAEKAELATIQSVLDAKKAKIAEVAEVLKALKEKEIPALETVTSADVKAIEAVKADIAEAVATYGNNMTDAEKAELEAIKAVLANREAKIAEVAEVIATLKAEEVPALETVTSADVEAIKALNAKVDEAIATYGNNMTDAEEAELEAIKKALAEDAEKIAEVAGVIATLKAEKVPALETVTSADAKAIETLKATVEDANATYGNNMTESEKAELEAIKKALAEREAKIEEVAEVISTLKAEAEELPSVDKVTSADAEAIKALNAKVDEAIATYGNNMTDAEEAELEAIKKALAEKEVAIQETADLLAEIRKEAEAIPAVENVTSNNETAIDVLLEKVDATDKVHKDKLTDAETAELATIKSALEAKKAVVVKVTDALARIEKAEQTLPKVNAVTSGDAETIKALAETIETTETSCGNNMTETEKAELEVIKNALAERKTKIAEVAEVISDIKADAEAIPEVDKVTSADADAIKALNAKVDEAIATYGNNMTAEEKAELEAIKKALAEKEVVIKDTADLLAEIRKAAEAIPAVDEVTSANAQAIDALNAKVDATSEVHKDKLTDAEKAELATIKTALGEKKAVVVKVKDALARIEKAEQTLPTVETVTSADVEAIKALNEKVAKAIDTYGNNMTESEEAELKGIQKALEKDAEKIAEVANVIYVLKAEKVPEVETVTSADADAIKALNAKVDEAKATYGNNMTAEEKDDLEGLQKALGKATAKIEEVANVISTLKAKAEAIPEVDKVTSADADAIEALNTDIADAIATYGKNMTAKEKDDLEGLQKALVEKEVAIQETADLLAEIRKEAEEIPAVDKVTSNNETAIDALLEKVDATGEVHKDKLTDAEKAELATIESALEAKKAVVVKVADALARIEKAEQTLPKVDAVTSGDAETIKALAETIETTKTSCGNNMTDAEKADLETIKNALAEREAKIAEVAEVISTLKAEAEAIPSVDKVTSADADAIKALNAKVDEAIATYGNNMTDAEKAELEAIKKALAEKEVVIKDTAELLAEIRKEAEAIPAVDKVTSADRVVVETLLEKVNATIEHHQDKLTDAEKAELEDIKKDLETKKNRIDEIKQVIEKLEEEAAKVPEMDELSSANSEHIEKVLDAIKAVLNNYSGNMTDEEITELNARMDILTEKLVYISQLPQYKPSEGDLENTTDSSKNAYNASLDNTDKELASKIPFTPVEKELIALGDEVDIYLEVKDISATVSATDKALVAGKLENTTDTLGMYIDVNLYKQVGDNLPQRISETNGLIKITFKVPESLLNDNSAIKRTYKIVRVHEGVAEFIDAEFNAEDKTLSFETDRFSTYALIYNDTKVADKSPVTGITDMTMYVLVLLAGIGIYCYGNKKKYFA